MDAMNISRQMIDFQKQSFKNFQQIWDLAQSQASGNVDRLMDQASWIPKEGRQALDNWRTFMKQEKERLRAYVDQSFAIYEKMLNVPKAVKPVKTKKTTDTK